jgi:hypothetical protein
MKILKNKKSKKHLNTLYFVNKGERTGQFLLFLEYNDKKSLYSVLTLPECEPIFISFSEIEKYLQDKNLEFVEEVPKDIIEHSLNEFNYRNSKLI